VEKILASGAIPVLFKPVAEDGADKKSCFYQHTKLRKPAVTDCAIDRDNAYSADAKARVAALFERIHQKYPAARIVDPLAVQCQGRHCLAVFDNTPLYDDTHHINVYASDLFAQWYLSRYPNPLRD